jgi:hypothetical protein
MSTIAHTFTEEDHIYHVDGHYVWATSDLIELAGLSSVEGIPSRVLGHASWRGDQVHLVTEYYENDCLDTHSIPDEIVPYFAGYLKFCTEHEVVTVPPLEKSIVYAYGDDKEILIGAHIDHRAFVDGNLYTLDKKSCYEYAGAAKKQNLLKWRMQLESYLTASEQDEEFWSMANEMFPGAADRPMGRMALHLHKTGDYTAYDFSEINDERAWEATVRLALLKVNNGHKFTRRNS